MKKFALVAAVALVLAACCCDPCRRPCNPCPCPCPGMATGGTSTATGPSVIDRIGGVKRIEAVIDDFLPRVMGDARVTGNPLVGAKLKTADPAAIRQRTVDFMCKMLGGACVYAGRDMKTAHHGLGITKAEWQAAAEDFSAALDHQGVAAPEKAEWLAAIGALEKDIVEKP